MEWHQTTSGRRAASGPQGHDGRQASRSRGRGGLPVPAEEGADGRRHSLLCFPLFSGVMASQGVS